MSPYIIFQNVMLRLEHCIFQQSCQCTLQTSAHQAQAGLVAQFTISYSELEMVRSKSEKSAEKMLIVILSSEF